MGESDDGAPHVRKAKWALLNTGVGLFLLLLGTGATDLQKFVYLLVGSLLVVNGVILTGTRAIVYWAVARTTAGETDPEERLSPDGGAGKVILGAAGVVMVLLVSAFGFAVSWLTSGDISVIFELWGWVFLGLFPLTILVFPFLLPWLALKYGAKQVTSASADPQRTGHPPGADDTGKPSPATDSTGSTTVDERADETVPGSGTTATTPDHATRSDEAGASGATPATPQGDAADPAATDGVAEGDAVRVRYTARVADSGEVVDTTDPDLARETGLKGADRIGGPRTVVVGDGSLFAPVERDLVGTTPGDTGLVTVQAATAFGPDPVESDVRTVAATDLPEGFRFEGAHVRLDGGYRYVETLVGSRARVDYGHPLAGQDIVVNYEVVETVDAPDVDPDPGPLVQYRETTADEPDDAGIDWGSTAREMRRSDE